MCPNRLVAGTWATYSAAMGDFLTFDVVDRPGRGAARTLLGLRRAPLPDGCRGLVPGITGDLAERATDVPYAPRRIALLAAWASEAAADASPLLAALGEGAREHWHVGGPLVHRTGESSWRGWLPEPESDHPVPKDQPVLVLISGELRTRHLRTFARNGIRATRQAVATPGYLGGLGFFTSPRNTTSVSAWRTAADARAFAFRPGAHATAMKTDLDGGHHVTERFLRLRPIRSSGSLRGVDPFADVLGTADLA